MNPSSEANSSSTSPEIPHVWWNKKKHYLFHEIPLQGLILSQKDPIHSPPPHSIPLTSTLILFGCPGISSRHFRPFRFVDQNPACISPLSHSCHMFRPSQPPCFIALLLERRGTAVAQWLRCCATNRKIAGSIPAGVIGIFH